jgi:glycosyltransferase involved in cell wall biosynthesis
MEKMVSGEFHPRLVYILRSYPRLSQTFILNEILALEQLGWHIRIFAVTHPHEPLVQSQVAEVRARVDYLEAVEQRNWLTILFEHTRFALAAPSRYLRCLRYVMQHPEFDQAYTSSSRFQCFLQAVYLARLLTHEQKQNGRGITHLHAHFAHDPTLIAHLIHMLTGLTYSFTAHARDLYQIPVPALAERIQEASAVITCCGANLRYIQQELPKPLAAKVRLIHHGVNLLSFQPASHAAKSSGRMQILAVGRLVEKKGFSELIRACQRLKQTGRCFQCVIYGEGPLHHTLVKLIEGLELVDEVALAGACTQQELLPMFQQADIFALTPCVTHDGDRDGVPNVLVEAMACALPVVTTSVGGITDLVRHDYNGLMVEPNDAEAIADELGALLDDAPRRRRLGEAARRTVIEHFDLHASAQQIAQIFERAMKGESCIPS